jgi:predicted O-methyltransferase YrrM
VRARQTRFPVSRSVLIKSGVFPIIDHYYEPLFNTARLRKRLDADRELPGISWNMEGQLALLERLRYGDELLDLPRTKPKSEIRYFLQNCNFGPGDAEVWYSMLRLLKPRRVVEVGSGYSTFLTQDAIRKNRAEDPTYSCSHTCIEPYEMPWLERTSAQVLRERVEDVSLDLFRRLEPNDVLFIDSTHVIRPQGDVVTELLNILPNLRPGVVVHFHDIFSPRDYLTEWVVNVIRLWNEQYMLEAFLTHNLSWEILAAVNHLHHHHYRALKAVCPHLTPDREPASFYIRRL